MSRALAIDVLPRRTRGLAAGRRGLVALLALAAGLAVVASRRRARSRRHPGPPVAPAGPAPSPSAVEFGAAAGGGSEFDHLEQERVAWPEPDDTLPEEIPVDAAEADVLEQAREVAADDDERDERVV